jgi:hypothetical protein
MIVTPSPEQLITLSNFLSLQFHHSISQVPNSPFLGLMNGDMMNPSQQVLSS